MKTEPTAAVLAPEELVRRARELFSRRSPAATAIATPRACPNWRAMVKNPEPVAKQLGGSAVVAAL